ncbi:SHR-binding domain of vacuolar-sorting associated protein 13 domain-containing protein [Ditylenchus destructor]|uniref:SHR-binding domain of vacuolar-sorting associated protein 13 domain-containing protein n=1 Tax=Ditylenchus destructor TaxID=166010 RepID=A0AAD4NHD6_9BILA|nr:SHR-binding domain of vacuolar-sorting associated protein 13 domain-containing protein [Ditylenchus destructor]
MDDNVSAFGELNLSGLRISGKCTQDGSFTIELKLRELIIEDKRKDTKIPRLLDKKSSSSKSSFFKMFYEQKFGLVQRVDLDSSQFYLILSPEFLGTLSNFVVVPQRKSTTTSASQEPSCPNKLHGMSATQQSRTIVKGNGTNTTSALPNSLKMMCTVRDIEVILVENPFKPDTSQTLILSFSAFLKADKKEGIQHFNGSIKDLQITRTYFAEDKRYTSCFSLLQRLDIVLTGSITEDTKVQIFELRVNKVHIKVSPSIIRLLSAVVTQFYENQINQQQSDRIELPKYSNYWEAKRIERKKHWFFREVADSAANADQSKDNCLATYTQKAHCAIERFVVTIETGLSDLIEPMIMLESSLKMTAENWSSQLSADANIEFQMSYYNEAFSVWEPIIEPTLDNGAWKCWLLNMSLRSYSDLDTEHRNTSDTESRMLTTQPPRMHVTLDGKQMMNITITKSFLQLTNDISKLFEEAAKQASLPQRMDLPGDSPYLVMNETGLLIRIHDSETLKVLDNATSIEVTHGSFVELEPINADRSLIALHTSDDDRRSILCLEILGVRREVNIMRAEKRCIRLPQEADSGRQWTILVDTRAENSRHVTYLRSLVNFVNHLDYPIEVYSVRGAKLALCGIVESGAKVMNIPIPLLYTASGEFYFQPADERYEPSNSAICWHNFGQMKRATLCCDLTSDITKGLYVECVIEQQNVMGERGRKYIDNIFTVHLFSPLYFQNLLPVPVHLTKPIESILKGGDGIQLNVVPGLSIEYVIDYNGIMYSCRLPIKRVHDDLEITQLRSKEDYHKVLNMGLNWSTHGLRRDLSIYAPYWMVNNTNRYLHYLINRYRVGHPPGRNPLLLPIEFSGFFGNKKARISIDKSHWSSEFPMATAGGQGRITCRGANGRSYDLTVDVQLCQSGLTKIVTFCPFYLIYNDSFFDIEVKEKESESDEWIAVSANSCIELWPTQKTKRKFLSIRYRGYENGSIFFPCTENFEGFCRMENECLGVYVTCSVADHSTIVRIEPFSPGMAPVVLINATKCPVKFRQIESNDKNRSSEMRFSQNVLLPEQMRAFTWEDVTCTNRKLEWNSGEHITITDLLRNEFGNYLPNKNGQHHFWVSFLNGRQRILLFTDDIALMTTAYEAYEMERIDIQAELYLHGVSLSLVNNHESSEVLYMEISSSAIVWEQFQRYRFKALTVAVMKECEAAYQQWLNEKCPENIVTIREYLLDFCNWTIKKKGSRRAESKLRRSFQSGLWVQLRQSLHQTQIHLKLNHLQIDNQRSACAFPCALMMVPPPKSVGADNAPVPFAELSFIMSQSKHTNIIQVKYLHLLVQEFAVKIDNGLINAMLSLFSSEAAQIPSYSRDVFAKDMELTRPKLSQKAIRTAASQLKAYYNDLHISPLMIHLSFSQGGSLSANKKGDSTSGGGTNIQSEFLNVLLKSVGVSVTEIQDAVFKLAYFERQHVFYNRPELEAEIQSHYVKQFIKQLYVVVLGLDIIGNPYGLVRDFGSGVADLFYQPYQGAIKGPEEFAEGAALGVRSLFSHTVGGAAGAASRITGTLGKGIAALTLDEKYQRKRQETLNRRPRNLGERLSRGAKGVGEGVYEGVTGIVTKPIEGAQEAGFGGFFKGVGQGLVGVVVKPVSGVVDFASGTLDGVKNAASSTKEMKQMRPPRFISSDQIVRPYSYEESFGYKIFREIDHGKYVASDYFLAHGKISDKLILIVTDSRVIMSKYHHLMGYWNTEWVLNYSEIKKPIHTSKGIALKLKERYRGFLGLGATSGKFVEFPDSSVRENVANRLINAYEAYVYQ